MHIKGRRDGFTHHLHIPNVRVPVERALPIAVVVAAVAVLTGSVPVVEQSRGVCGGGAVPARLLLPIYLGRGMLLKMRQRIRIVVISHSSIIHESIQECESRERRRTRNPRTFGEEDDDVEDLWCCGGWWWLNGGAADGGAGGGGRGSSSTESRGCCEPDRRVDEEEDLREGE